MPEKILSKLLFNENRIIRKLMEVENGQGAGLKIADTLICVGLCPYHVVVGISLYIC